MLASCMMYLLAWAVLRWRTREGSLFGPFITIAYPAIFTVFMASTFFVGRLRGMVWGDGSQDPSNEARKIMYREGFPMVLKNPLGYGWGMGARTLGYTNGAGTLTIDTYYLAIALELGVLGFLVYYGFFLLILAKSGLAVLNLKDRDALFLIPIAIAFVNFIISKSVFSNQENHPLVFVMAGIAIALLKRNADAEAEAQAQRRQALATV
jgi:O-antigen ligase